MISAATRPVRRSRAVLLCTALLWVSSVWTPGTAQAAACSGGDGVTVVVDYGPYGGIETGCAPGPTNGLSALSQAGFNVVQVTSQPGFVCRIDGAPPAEDDACVRTPPVTAHWSYWQAAPGSTSWMYSGSGAAGTQPADGATEGWSFGDTEAPGISPPANVAPPPPATGGHPPPTGANPTTTTNPGAPTAAGESSDPRGSTGATPTGTTSSGPPPSGASSPTASSGEPSSGGPSSGGSSSTPASAGPATSGGSGRADGSAAVPGPLAPGGAPWGVLVASVVAVALGGGAYWQIRRRR